jgi:hypothetical protein
MAQLLRWPMLSLAGAAVFPAPFFRTVLCDLRHRHTTRWRRCIVCCRLMASFEPGGIFMLRCISDPVHHVCLFFFFR